MSSSAQTNSHLLLTAYAPHTAMYRPTIKDPIIQNATGAFSYFEQETRTVQLTASYVSGSNTDVGIGVSVEQDHQGITYIGGIIPGGPADLEGIKCGDAILQVDGVSVFGLNAAQVMRRLCGTPGSPVVLRIGLRPFSFYKPICPENVRTVTVTRSTPLATVYLPASTLDSRSAVISSNSNNNNNNNINNNKTPVLSLYEQAKNAFRQFDSDGNGLIDRDEYDGALISLGYKIQPEQSTAFFETIDQDGDGFISFNEFLGWIEPEEQFLRPTVK